MLLSDCLARVQMFAGFLSSARIWKCFFLAFPPQIVEKQEQTICQISIFFYSIDFVSFSEICRSEIYMPEVIFLQKIKISEGYCLQQTYHKVVCFLSHPVTYLSLKRKAAWVTLSRSLGLLGYAFAALYI